MPSQHLQVSAYRFRRTQQILHENCVADMWRPVVTISCMLSLSLSRSTRQLADLAQQLASQEEVVKAAEKRAEDSEAAHKKTKVCEHWSVLHACDHLPPCCCVVP